MCKHSQINMLPEIVHTIYYVLWRQKHTFRLWWKIFTVTINVVVDCSANMKCAQTNKPAKEVILLSFCARVSEDFQTHTQKKKYCRCTRRKFLRISQRFVLSEMLAECFHKSCALVETWELYKTIYASSIGFLRFSSPPQNLRIVTFKFTFQWCNNFVAIIALWWPHQECALRINSWPAGKLSQFTVIHSLIPLPATTVHNT